jgi:hypothetical protein
MTDATQTASSIETSNAPSPQLARLRSFLERYVRVTVADGRVLVGKLWVNICVASFADGASRSQLLQPARSSI